MLSGALLSTAEMEAYLKCAQFYTVIYSDATDESMLEQARRIIKKKGDINYQVPLTSLIWPENLKNGTLLHIACRSHAGEIFEELLNNGADFTIKNEQGDTALHCAFEAFPSWSRYSYNQDHSDINSMLSAHVKFGNSSNPCNNDGISHFHIACMANHVKAVEFFLKNGVDMNYAIHQESEKYSGFTPLHIAIKYFSVETVELLLKYNVNRCTKNGYNLTPLQQLLKQRIALLGSEAMHVKEEHVQENLGKKIENSRKIVNMLLGNNFLDKVDIIDSIGLTNFHIVCMLEDLSKVESLLEQVEDIHHCVNIDSPMWPGYTALHFAASCNNFSILELLVHKKGGNMDVKNAEGFTPFDICINNGHIEGIHTAISLKSEWANILFSDNKTRLGDFTSALRDITQLSNFLRNCVGDINMTLPSNSPLWPGYTLLHVAVTLSRKYKEGQEIHKGVWMVSSKGSILQQIETLLNHGADVAWRDINGRTPLYHAFRADKTEVIEQLCQHHSFENPVDKDNLSHLHIVCALHDERLVERLIKRKDIDVNIPYRGEKDVQHIKPGWTPLNCARNCKNIKKMLLQRGATEYFPEKDRYDKNTLHSACDKGDVDAVQRLLELGADVNLTLDDGRTPLHVAVYKNSLEVVELLLHRGADLIAKDNEGQIPLYRLLSTNKDVPLYRHLMISVLKHHDELQKRMEQETGVTMLHIACYMLDVDEVRNKLEQGAEVNSRVHDDSKLWPGCTALHVLMTKVKDGFSEGKAASNVNIITDLLLENGADITMGNANKDTAIHISHNCKDESSVSRTISLLKHHQDFRINPVDSDGVSYFHIAVMTNNVETVEKFLEHGVNVNQPPDFFAKPYDGCTPLHMAINNMEHEQSKIRIVELLLNSGADVNLEDIRGNSALHKAIKISSSRLYLMEKLLSLGANINSENIYGVTPFLSLLYSNDVSVGDIRFFVEHGCRVNVSSLLDGQGSVAIILAKKDKHYRDLLLDEMMKARDVGVVNELSRTLIHNSVAIRQVAISSVEYVDLFNRFNGMGFDVDDQDLTGLTALHLATIFNNYQAVLALLYCGADSNILDSKDKSALSYALKRNIRRSHLDIAQALVKRALQLDNLGLDVDRINHEDITRSYKIMSRRDTDLSVNFFKGIEYAKDFTITPLQLTVGDFLSEMGVVIRYSRLTEASRDIVDRAFESIDPRHKEILPILKLQHRKAVTRFRLVERVADLKPLLGFSMPALCADIILSFLTTEDLKNVVRAVDLLN